MLIGCWERETECLQPAEWEGGVTSALHGGFQSKMMTLHWVAGRRGHQRKESVPEVQILNGT